MFLIASSVMSCGHDCRDEPYKPYSIEIYTQQINTASRRFPADLRWLLQPIVPEPDLVEERCYCPGSGIDSLSETPYVTMMRIDSGSPIDTFQIHLVAGVGLIPTYRQYHEGIDARLESLVLPYDYEKPNRAIASKMLEPLVAVKTAIFCYDPRLHGAIQTIELLGKRYKIYDRETEIVAEIGRLAADHYEGRREAVANDFGPKIMILYALDWASIDASQDTVARIGASATVAHVGDIIRFEDLSVPANLLEGGTWRLGEGESKPYQRSVDHAFMALGTHRVILCGHDGKTCDTLEISIVPPPPPPPPPCTVMTKIARIPNLIRPCDTIVFADASVIQGENCFFGRTWMLDSKVVGHDSILRYVFPTAAKYNLRLVRWKNQDMAFPVDSAIKVIPHQSSTPMRLTLKDTIISWTPLGNGCRYLVEIKDRNDPKRIIFKELMSATRLRLLPRIHNRDVCRIKVTALACGKETDTASAVFDMVLHDGRVIINPTCQNH